MSTRLFMPFFVIIIAILSIGCGGGFKNPNLTSKSFISKMTDSNSGQTDTDDYIIDIENSNLGSIRRPENLNLTIAENALAQSIVGLKIDAAQDSEDLIQIKISIQQAKNREVEELIFAANLTTSSALQEINSADNKFSLTLDCKSAKCDEAWFKLKNNATNEIAEIRYRQSLQYLTNEDRENFKFKTDDTGLVDEAIEYSFPVIRHQAEITFGKTLDLLVIQRPDTDEIEESFSETDPTNETTPKILPDSLPQIPVEKKITPATVELTAIDRQIHVAPVNKTPDKKSPVSKVPPAKEKSPSSGQTEAPQRLKLTPNPFEAYGLELPTQNLNTGNGPIKDPLALTRIFNILPADQQAPLEPAFRIAMIARLFIDQKIKVYKNACNIYVRSVMLLAGYTRGETYSANEFSQLFKTNGQGLKNWNKVNFIKSASPQTELARLDQELKGLSENYGTIIQVDRSQSGRHGHVGIVVAENGEVAIYDSSLNVRGPRRTVVQASNLLSKSRPNVNMFILPDVRKAH